MLTRLQSAAPVLDEILRKADKRRCHVAGWAAARWAVSLVGLDHPVVAEGLASGELGALPSLVEELDNYYFNLEAESDTTEESMREVEAAFSRARAAAAVEFAARGEPDEAIYEAGIAARADWSALQSVVEASLRE